MADKNLNINIVAKDKSKQALNKVQGNLDKTKSAVFNLRNALVGLGAGLIVKSFIDVGKSIENLQVRLKFLFGSVEEGARAFDAMAKFASKVPFSLGEIQKGAGVLAVVSKDADELAKIMELTGNVAAVTGLDFATTSEQIQRSLSAGISSADLFREKGVKSMLGFSAGATVSIKETRDALFNTFGANGEFAGATDELAKTLEGTLSMIGDKYFNFQKEVAEKFFVALKKEFGALDVALAENEKTILQIAKAVGTGLANAVTLGADAFRFLLDNIELIKKAGLALVVFGMSKAFIGLSIAIGRASIAMVAFTKVSMKNIAGLLAAGAILLADYTGFLDKLLSAFDKPKTIEDFAAAVEILNLQLSALEQSNTPEYDKLQTEAAKLKDELTALIPSLEGNAVAMENVKLMIESINESLHDIPFEEMSIGFEETTNSLGFLTEKMGEFKEGFKGAMDKDIAETFAKAGKTAFTSLKSTLTDFVMTGKLSMKSFGEAIKRALVEALIGSAIQFALKKSLALFKADSIKKALMSVYQGALKTFASIPFPFNIAAAAGAVAVGMGMVNKIKGFEKGGRPPVGRASLVGEGGPELFLPDSAGTIIPNNQLGGNQTINVNIHANDTQGFDELLIKRRATIVNVINDALNSQGKEALV